MEARRNVGWYAAVAALCCVFWSDSGRSQLGPDDAGKNYVAPVVEGVEWGRREFDGEILSGTVVVMADRRRAVLVQARDRVELWEVGADSRIEDTGHARWLADGRTVRVEWEQREREDFSASRKGSWPWKPSGDRFAAFRLSDWLIEKGDAVGLPFLGGESVGFSLERGGIAKAGTKSGGEVEGRWWWSGGLFHLRLEGFKEVATYEWRALAGHVGWSERETAPVGGVTVERGLKQAMPVSEAVSDRVEANDGVADVPGKVALCRRDVLAALLRTAAERSDVVSALGIEQQVLVACGERQKLVLQIVEAERQLAEVLGQDGEEATRPPPPPVAVKTVAQLVEVVRPEDTGAQSAVVVDPEPQDAVERGEQVSGIAKAPVPAAARPGREATWSWFSLLGREGKLVAGITDGSGAWFVAEGEEVPGGGTVRRITARPPGVEMAGVGMLRWAERPPANPVSAVGADRGRDAGRAGGARVPDGKRDEVLDRVVESVLGRAVRANVEKIYAGSPNYGTAQTNLVPVLASRGLIPDSAMVGSGNTATIRHPFGGSVTLHGNPGGSVPTQFRIRFREIEGEVCGALSDPFVGRTRARTGIVSIGFNGTVVTAPVNRGQVTTNCNAFPAAGGNLTFIFG